MFVFSPYFEFYIGRCDIKYFCLCNYPPPCGVSVPGPFWKIWWNFLQRKSFITDIYFLWCLCAFAIFKILDGTCYKGNPLQQIYISNFDILRESPMQCFVLWRGLTTCLRYVNPLFGTLVFNNGWSVSLILWKMFCFFFFTLTYIYLLKS